MKVTVKSNYRVVIEPENRYMFTHPTNEQRAKDEKDKCEQIEEQVKRHCDDVGRVSIEFDTDIICGYCKGTWEIDEVGQPMCCEKAIEEYEKTKN